MASRKRAKRPKKAKRPRKIQVATGRKARATRKSMIKPKKKYKIVGAKQGEYKGYTRYTEVMSHAISPRARGMTRGVSAFMEKPPEDMPQSVQDFFLSSRAIARAAYDRVNHILEIWFTTGHGYQFFSVPIDVWRRFQMAQSKGRFFMEQIYGYWAGPKGDKTYFPNYTYREIS